MIVQEKKQANQPSRQVSAYPCKCKEQVRKPMIGKKVIGIITPHIEKGK